MSLVLNVEILGEFKKLTSATQGAQSQLTTMGNKAATISKGIKRAFAGIGIGLSFVVLAREIGDATKAAIDDRQSQELLALAMQNTTNATDAQIAAAEQAISKMQFQAGVADDVLRPSYQKLFIATGSVTESNRLLQIALDASASTGLSLDTVSQAMAKSLAGSDTALTKLIPSLRDSKDPIEAMALAFDGAATKAANLDPYNKLNIVFGDIQDKLGTALLPVLDKFSAWISTPKGQETIDAVAKSAGDVLIALGNVATWAFENKNWLAPLVIGVAGFATTVTAINKITTAVNGITTAINVMKIAAGSSLLAGLAASAAVVGAGAAGSAYGGYLNQKALTEQNKILFAGGTKTDPFAGLGKIGAGGYVPKAAPKPGTPAAGARGNVNITINTPKVNAQDIVNTINRSTRNGYTGDFIRPRG